MGHIPSFDKKQDGRSAFKKLDNHFLNGSAKESIVSEAEGVLERINFSGERKNFSFEKFITKFIAAYNDLEDYGGQTILDSSKVTKLLNKITDPKLEATKTVILSNDVYKTNFENAKNLFLAQMATNKRSDLSNRSVSCATTEHGGRGRGGRGQRGSTGRGFYCGYGFCRHG